MYRSDVFSKYSTQRDILQRGSLVTHGCKRRPTGRPTYLVYHSYFCFVYSQYFQLLALILMKNPILKITGSLAIIKLQKRSESNVLSKLSINKIYRKKRLRKCWNPTTSKTPDGRCQGFYLILLRSEKERFLLRPWEKACYNDRKYQEVATL